MLFVRGFAAFLALASAASAADASIPARRLQDPVPYAPGDFSLGNVIEDTARGTKLFLSNGLMGRVLGYDGETIALDSGAVQPQQTDGSSTPLTTYHNASDGGATIPKADGGYYYVSNSEQGSYPDIDFTADLDRSLYDTLSGGVYALEFNSDHEFVGYTQVLGQTALNCAGGVTPWNTWISCEEHPMWGRCWQVDPSGSIPPKPTNVTGIWGLENYGKWEAFAWDPDHKVAFITDDDKSEGPAFRGAVIRFTPDATALACLDASDDAGKWCVLESGTHDYLKLNDDNTFEWVSDPSEANPSGNYEGSEGIHYENGIVTFVSFVEKTIIRLNVKDNTYTVQPVPFSQEPDNIRIFNDVLYICTDGDHEPGDAVWGVDDKGAFRVFYEEGHNYPAGIAFSPDGKRMYASMWGEATYQFWREDGLGFDDASTEIAYEVTFDGEDTTENVGEPSGAGGSDASATTSAGLLHFSSAVSMVIAAFGFLML